MRNGITPEDDPLAIAKRCGKRRNCHTQRRNDNQMLHIHAISIPYLRSLPSVYVLCKNSRRVDLSSKWVLGISYNIMQYIKKTSKLLSAVLTALLAIFGTLSFAGCDQESSNKPEKKQAQKGQKTSKKRPKKNRPTQTLAQRSQERANKEKPQLLEDLDDEAQLTAAERALLEELQAGIDANSLRQVAKTVEKIHKLIREKGESAVPPIIRSEAVEALGWFLPDSLADLIPFMADSDPDVLEDVMSQFESAIDDSSLGDRELSNILKSVSKVLNDEDALEALFMGIESDMRNSVAVETYLYILEHGSEAAKAHVWESIEDFTGEENIKTVEDLKKWANDPENADDEDDDDFYGGDKDDKDDEDDVPAATAAKK